MSAEIRTGCIIKPNARHEDGVLASGCGIYHSALVLSVKPFRLISEEGDMVWYHQKPENFEVVGPAGKAVLDAALARFRRSPDDFDGVDLDAIFGEGWDDQPRTGL